MEKGRRQERAWTTNVKNENLSLNRESCVIIYPPEKKEEFSAVNDRCRFSLRLLSEVYSKRLRPRHVVVHDHRRSVALEMGFAVASGVSCLSGRVHNLTDEIASSWCHSFIDWGRSRWLCRRGHCRGHSRHYWWLVVINRDDVNHGALPPSCLRRQRAGWWIVNPHTWIDVGDLSVARWWPGILVRAWFVRLPRCIAGPPPPPPYMPPGRPPPGALSPFRPGTPSLGGSPDASLPWPKPLLSWPIPVWPPPCPGPRGPSRPVLLDREFSLRYPPFQLEVPAEFLPEYPAGPLNGPRSPRKFCSFRIATSAFCMSERKATRVFAGER